MKYLGLFLILVIFSKCGDGIIQDGNYFPFHKMDTLNDGTINIRYFRVKTKCIRHKTDTIVKDITDRYSVSHKVLEIVDNCIEEKTDTIYQVN